MFINWFLILISTVQHSGVYKDYSDARRVVKIDFVNGTLLKIFINSL